MVKRLTPSGLPPAEAAIAPAHLLAPSTGARDVSRQDPPSEGGATDDEGETTPFVAHTFSDPDCIPTTPLARYPQVREPTLLTVRSASDGQDALRAHVAARPVPSSRPGQCDWDEVRRPKVAFNPRLRVTAEAVRDLSPFVAPVASGQSAPFDRSQLADEQDARRRETMPPMAGRKALAAAAARLVDDAIPSAAPSVAPLVVSVPEQCFLPQKPPAYQTAWKTSRWTTALGFVALVGVVCLALVTGWEVVEQSQVREAAGEAALVQGVRVDSAQPGVTVTVDERERHALPANVRLPAGTHQLRFEADETYDAVDRTVVVAPGEWLSLSEISLPLRRAQLKIEVVHPLGEPIGAVLLQQRGTEIRKRVEGPFPRVVTIPPRGWDLIVEQDGYERYVWPVRLSAGEPAKTVWVNLTPSSLSP